MGISEIVDYVVSGEATEHTGNTIREIGIPLAVAGGLAALAALGGNSDGLANSSSTQSQPDKPPVGNQIGGNGVQKFQPGAEVRSDVIFHGVGFNKKPDENHPPSCETAVVAGLLSSGVRDQKKITPSQKLYMEKNKQSPNFGWWCGPTGQRIFNKSK